METPTQAEVELRLYPTLQWSWMGGPKGYTPVKSLEL